MRRGTARHERSNLSKKAAVCCLRPRRPRGSISGSPAHRRAEGRIERFTELAAEFARLKVDLIVAATTPAVIAAKHGELHVVAPEFDDGDAQALVVANGFIPIISTTRSLVCFAGCASVATLRPFAWNRHVSSSEISLTKHCGPPEGDRKGLSGSAE
jgi:hypothetical protein